MGIVSSLLVRGVSTDCRMCLYFPKVETGSGTYKDTDWVRDVSRQGTIFRQTS